MSSAANCRFHFKVKIRGMGFGYLLVQKEKLILFIAFNALRSKEKFNFGMMGSFHIFLSSEHFFC